MSKIQLPIALQAYSLRSIYCGNPLQGLRAAKEAGYDGIEFFGNDFCTDFYAALLKETGLVCAGWHTMVEDLEGDAFEKTLRRNIAVGCKYVIVPWFGADDLDGWKRFADRLNVIAAKLARYGMRTGYHSYAGDHKNANGYIPWEVVAANTDPRVVLQLDTGNAMAGGADVCEALAKFPGRNQSIHLKPYAVEGGYAPVIGKDDLPWEKILNWCENDGATEWCVVEYEMEDDPVTAVAQCLAHLRSLRP